MHKFRDQGASSGGSVGCVSAFREALDRARNSNRSMGLRVTKYDVWFAVETRVALREGELEIATVHCDGRIEFTKLH